MDKLVFKVPRPAKVRERSAVIRVSKDAYNAIESISAKTGLSNSYIASQMVAFAAENTKVVFDCEDEE